MCVCVGEVGEQKVQMSGRREVSISRNSFDVHCQLLCEHYESGVFSFIVD